MDDVFVGEIRAVGFSFAPKGWAVCDGSLLQIRSNAALFSLLGTTYGGNGQITFGLPDLRGRAIVNAGQGTGLANYPLGNLTGQESVTLDQSQLPTHVHGLSNVNIGPGNGGSNSPTGNYLANSSVPQYGEEAGSAVMAANLITGAAGPAGGSQPHDNRQPFLAVTYIIALQGIFPSRP